MFHNVVVTFMVLGMTARNKRCLDLCAFVLMYVYDTLRHDSCRVCHLARCVFRG